MTKSKLIILFAAIGIPLISIGQKTSKSVAVTIKSVKIAKQEWMVTNLNISKFRNGDLILEAKTDDEWVRAGDTQKPAWCYYNNDSKNGPKYGKLYNWYAVNDPRGLAPKGWHIPSEAEATSLIDNLGGGTNAASAMKSTSGWLSNGNGNNHSGLTCFPAGLRFTNGPFDTIGAGASWWSSSAGSSNESAWSFGFSDSADKVDIDKRWGFSVRCLKD